MGVPTEKGSISIYVIKPGRATFGKRGQDTLIDEYIHFNITRSFVYA
jgi:hypothetical protein